MIIIKKYKIRKIYKEKRNNYNKKELYKKNKDIFYKLIDLEEYKESRSIFTYVSINNEVDTIELIKYSLSIGKKVAVPVVRGEEMIFSNINDISILKKSRFSLLEPPEDSLDIIVPDKNSLIIVPGLVFDKNKNRIGYGGGYYDKYLSKYKEYKASIGLCYDFQMISSIETEECDIPLDNIIYA